MLRPIEFDTARDPRPQQSHERWLDYILPIEKSYPFILSWPMGFYRRFPEES